MNSAQDQKISNIENLLMDLIKFKTVEKNKEELKSIIDYCYSYLKANDKLVFDIFEVNSKWNLICNYGEKVDVYFVVHLDVVDANDEQFNPVLKEGRIYGRGALDMKGPASVVIELFKNLNDKKYPLGLILTTDEEVGSHNGVKYIVENKHIEAKMVIIPDGGENFRIITKGKGALHFKAKSYGKSCHGSTPWEGNNAIDNLISFYQKLKEIILLNEDLNDEKHWHNTINLGKIDGGQKVNIVPSFAEAHIDIRFTEKYSLNQLINLTTYLASKYNIEIEILSTGNPVNVDVNSEYFQKFIKAYKNVIGDPKFDVEHGATDGRFFSNIPVITIYPIGSGIHSEEEWVDISSLYQLYSLFYEFVKNL